MTRLAELRALLTKATQGPWTACAPDEGEWPINTNGDTVAYCDCEDHQELIVAAVNALPALLDVFDKAVAMVEPYPRTMPEIEAIMRRRVAQDALKLAIADFEAGSKMSIR